MRAKLPAVFNAALAYTAALLLAWTLAPFVYAQAARQQTRSRRTAPPSSTAARVPTETRDAQTPTTGGTGSRPEESETQADLSITARVTADSLRFEKVPDPKVEFTGRPRRETVWQSERENLPQQVQPGVTYRNIGITLRITSVFADIDRIVAEALGEVPASDDAQPAPVPSTPPGASESQESRLAPTPSPARANTRATTRGRHERRGRGM